MKPNDVKLPDVEALVAFGKLGVKLLAARVLTIGALVGVLALAAYSVYTSSWQGVALVAFLAMLVFKPALEAETGQRDREPDRGEA